MGEADADAGTEVVTVDESGSTVYLIEAGEAEVVDAGGPVPVVLGQGDTFGEIGLLLTAGKRTATVVARTPVKLLALSEPDFERIRGQIPEFERSLRSLGLERSRDSPINDRHPGVDTRPSSRCFRWKLPLPCYFSASCTAPAQGPRLATCVNAARS